MKKLALLFTSVVLLILLGSGQIHAQTWQCTPPLTPICTLRSEIAAAVADVSGTKRIYVIGGIFGGSATGHEVEAYDPASNTWTCPLAPIPTGRATVRLAIATGSNGKIYLFGGQIGNQQTDQVDEYDPGNNSWQTKLSMTTARWFPTAALGQDGSGNNLIFVFGGETQLSPFVLTTVEAYDPVQDTWHAKLPMQFGLSGAVKVAASNGRIYVFDGSGIGTVAEYNPTNDTWVQKTGMPSVRDGFAVTTGPDGKIYVMGGHMGSVCDVDVVDVYDPINDTWTSAPSNCTKRNRVGAVTLGCYVYSIGHGGTHGGCPDFGDPTLFGKIERLGPFSACGTGTGACCLPNGGCNLVNGQTACDALGGFYWGDGTTCTPTNCLSQLVGSKFEDINGDGTWDTGEPPIQGVTIDLLKFGAAAPLTAVTNVSGSWDSGPISAGQYRVYETVPTGMVQTAPSTVYYLVSLPPAVGVAVLPFGNQDTCVSARQHVDTCRAGRNDNYDQSDGVELAFPSASVCAQLQPGNCSAGPRNTCHPALGNCSEFDCPGGNMCFGHSFTGCWDSTCTVVHAQLHVRVRASAGGSDNDGLQLWHNGVWLGDVSFSALNSGHWVSPDALDTWLSLEGLTTNLGITNVLGALQDGDLDVIIQDDTEVDFLELVVTTCCNCVAPPDSMVGWWDFDALATPFGDLAGTVNNAGTYVGSTPAIVGGCISGALSLHGNDYVSANDQAELDFGGGNFSIDAWIRTTTATGLAPIVDKRSGTGLPGSPLLGYSLYLSNGNLGFQMADGAGSDCSCGGGAQCNNYIASGPNIADGLCHHVAVTVNRQAASGILYVDCVPVLTFTPRLGNLDNSGDLWIGRRHSNPCAPSDAYWVGEIDEVELYNKALSATELATLCNPAGKCKPVGCLCPCWADPQCDGVRSDVLDVVQTINVAFRGTLATTDPECMTQRTDVNCSGATDVIDVVKMINVAFRGANIATEFCNPCP